jgi:hypothetical protein
MDTLHKGDDDYDDDDVNTNNRNLIKKEAENILKYKELVTEN